MKNISTIILLFVLLSLDKTVRAQVPTTKDTVEGKNIEMLFPGGKTKALIISMDDGRDADRRLVELLNKYGIKGTFHLNSGKLGTKDYLKKEEIRTLYKNHEVSVHSANHPPLSKLSAKEIRDEILLDRQELERLTGKIINGMAYPFGNYNDTVVAIAKECGINYARTVEDSYNFSIPTNFLLWTPTIHQFGKAYFIPNDSLNNQKELALFYNTINQFLAADTLALLDVWGHSWENDGEGNRWLEMEKFLQLVDHNLIICYTTQIDLVNYINAYKSLQYSINKRIISNNSSIDIFIKRGHKSFTIKAGETIRFTE